MSSVNVKFIHIHRVIHMYRTKYFYQFIYSPKYSTHLGASNQFICIVIVSKRCWSGTNKTQQTYDIIQERNPLKLKSF